ncbi:sensor histidine kinase [Paenibacillus eucommiae]|uniref:histidine kinase n=1 Tax=Paenibacillus eucommiae TaxID=1355755 RepID=A0ABS4ISK0_9BACL|nr:HAMP domain-containing sensor histidine kinase [Paenibacillus eucommiae]MBP1990543.1 signal transduction histidine kinase [Paenibacillus eucommiae]
MSIKTRLLLSYMAMTIIPAILCVLTAVALFPVLMKDKADDGGRKGVPVFWAASSEREELIAGIKFMAREDPTRFTDIHFLQKTDKQLNDLKAGLVVRLDNRITFASSYVNSSDLDTQLERKTADQGQNHWGGVKINDRFSVVQYDISISGQHTGKVYVLSDASLFKSARIFFPLILLSLLAAVGLTNGILTYLVSRNLIKPLYALKHAAEQIKAGDLEHKVNLNRKDEIGDLGAAFEGMRVRLNESIHLQLQYEENRKELISNISHDLKTPITGIKACVEGIQDGIAPIGPKRDKYMAMIAKKTEEMDRLIEELFLFSKLDLKRLPFNLEPTDLAAYLHDCVEELRLDPRITGIPLTFSYSGAGPLPVTADREKLHRVIMNIINNSLNYMDKAQKEIRIELIDSHAAATVIIRDNGAGIEGAALPYIFDRFYRAEPSRSKATGGSGLGLAIVKQIIEGQGGHVWAESQVGEGTGIYFTLRKIGNGGGSS